MSRKDHGTAGISQMVHRTVSNYPRRPPTYPKPFWRWLRLQSTCIECEGIGNEVQKFARDQSHGSLRTVELLFQTNVLILIVAGLVVVLDIVRIPASLMLLLAITWAPITRVQTWPS
jgi:hypothetical protein